MMTEQMQTAEATERPAITVIGLSRMDYARALELQLALRDDCIASGGRRSYLMLVEHPPTITIGRAGDARDVLADEQTLRERGVTVVQTNRGGQVTCHGPGQLVIYPILSLAGRGRDLRRYLRDLEGWLVRLCRSYGVPAHARPGQTGVWVEDRKIASIGIAVRRWVTCHGAALNVGIDLSLFNLIVPCGMAEAKMTSLELELGHALSLQEVAKRAAHIFAQDFSFNLDFAAEVSQVR